jgi:hypothetical protein
VLWESCGLLHTHSEVLQSSSIALPSMQLFVASTPKLSRIFACRCCTRPVHGHLKLKEGSETFFLIN